MASTLVSSKSNSKNSSTNNTTTNGNSNETPITEEELKKKETPITINDVLRLRKSTNSYLTETDDNVYKIDFVHFRIRDMKTNKILFEVERGSNDDDFNDEIDPSAGRFVQYHFPSSFLKLKQVGALVDFTVGDREVKSFRMIERHYFRDQLIKSFDFDFGFCPPNTRNSIEHIYDMPEFDSKQIKDMIEHPNETKSDSFYFVDNQLIMHKKATYAFDLDRPH
ncbi:unnamed protein product [Rotaria sp. Silwood1]|nr:unnamed protein product [Rotaria sp. Silwood1]CAF0969090.1 unnamed protein product [Rotaria sp. Silwood1]CAF3409655.1 unnamed protein product [Rotaria sp. Silwood1]CAF3414644.1 unnamed protein product [Rotaria sp. Silwood1]CAF4791795.1 unnamed protein product [Rotaria sp. Silwood1]